MAKKEKKNVYVSALDCLYQYIMVLDGEIARLSKGGTQESSKRILRILSKQFSNLANIYGRAYEKFSRYWATRIVAEMGVQIVKTYYCDNFEEVVAACPVPIVVAGGKKLPEDEAMTLAYRSIQGGARGVDMGRNIFQSPHSVEMSQAIRKIVHEGYTDKEAYEFFQDAIH